MLDFDVIVRRVMALSLERIIWYDFNGFLNVEVFVEEPFFSCQQADREGRKPEVFMKGKLTKCGHLEVKTFHLASLILSL
jgi:hypothetical protein